MNGHKTCLHFTSSTPGLGFWVCHLGFLIHFLSTELKLGQRTEKSPMKISFQPKPPLMRIVTNVILFVEIQKPRTQSTHT